MTRSEAVIAAVAQTIRRWAREVDGGSDIRALTVSVKLSPGTARPRAVVCRVESETKLLLPGSES